MEITTLQGQEGIDAINQAKENYRSRNHYGRTYTLLKMENHIQNVEIARLKETQETQAKMQAEIEKVVNKWYIIGIALGTACGVISVFIVRAIQGGL